MSYFKPWRRKSGLVTLLIACLLLTAWLYTRDDFYSIGANRSSYRVIVVSTDNGLHFFCMDYVTGYKLFRYFQCKATDVVGGQFIGQSWKYAPDSYEPHAEAKIKWRWDWAGLHASQFESDIDLQSIWSNSTFNRERQFLYWAVPFSIVIPSLAVVSAWLLLSRSRTSRKYLIATEGPSV